MRRRLALAVAFATLVGGLTFVGLTLYATHARTKAPRIPSALPEKVRVPAK